MDLREIGWEDVEWAKLTQDRGQWRAVVNAVNLRVLTPRSWLVSYLVLPIYLRIHAASTPRTTTFSPP
jgi:hypothetical protein